MAPRATEDFNEIGRPSWTAHQARDGWTKSSQRKSPERRDRLAGVFSLLFWASKAFLQDIAIRPVGVASRRDTDMFIAEKRF